MVAGRHASVLGGGVWGAQPPSGWAGGLGEGWAPPGIQPAAGGALSILIVFLSKKWFSCFRG